MANNMITDQDAEKIANAVAKITDVPMSADESAMHQDHHSWITRQIEKERRSAERWERARHTAVGALVIGALSCLAALGEWAWSIFSKGLSN